VAVLGIYLARVVRSGTRQFIVISMVLMAAALYFTYTRSALLALVLGLVALFLFLRTRIKGKIILAAMLLLIAFIAISGITEGHYLWGRAESIQEESSISRKILWQTGTAIAVDNPILGIGAYRFTEVSAQYSDKVDPSLLAWEQEQYWGYATLGSEAVHNDFLAVWVSYGTLALIAYLWLYFAILRNLLDSHRASTSRFIKGLSIGLAAALIGYAVNSFYHNAMGTLPLFWILAGFSVVAANLALRRQDETKTAKESMDIDLRGINE
jgi:O-antigen ligase